jgi:hypothetical protein
LVPVLALRPVHTFVTGTIPVLTWCEAGYRSHSCCPFLAAADAFVLFTIIVQGLSLTRLVERVVP